MVCAMRQVMQTEKIFQIYIHAMTCLFFFEKIVSTYACTNMLHHVCPVAVFCQHQVLARHHTGAWRGMGGLDRLADCITMGRARQDRVGESRCSRREMLARGGRRIGHLGRYFADLWYLTVVRDQGEGWSRG